MFDVLGVSRDASDDDIKKAYKKLAMQHHPDRGGDAEVFKKISSAYEVLSDPVKRRELDIPAGFRVSPPKQYEFNITVPLDEAWLGVNKNIRVIRKKRCPTCNGHGHFVGEMRMGPFIHSMHHGCRRCFTQGELGEEEQVMLVLEIPKRMQEGTRIVKDDITFNIGVAPHPVFKRQGNSLAWEPEISFEDSVNGTTITCPHFDGPFELDTKTLGVIDPRKRYSLSQGVLATFNVKYPPVGSGHKVSQEMVQ
jgi:DnaJ-class molecular chaperone